MHLTGTFIFHEFLFLFIIRNLNFCPAHSKALYIGSKILHIWRQINITSQVVSQSLYTMHHL